MEVQELSIPSSNKFVNDYLSDVIPVSEFFDYNIHSTSVYEDRLKDLSSRKFNRESLVSYLLDFNHKYNCSEGTIQNIRKLRDPKSSVVIGGQQAGLLTGPLYTIHKIISILQLAKQQEEKLQAPVLPVFWIAGEDHDFAEINHLYIQTNEKIQKKSLPQYQIKKNMVSDIPIDKEVCLKWIEEIVESFGETEQTNQLLEMLEDALSKSETFVDFFIYVINGMFKDSGLILINSASSGLRQLESNLFQDLVHRRSDITNAVINQQEKLKKYGIKHSIEVHEQSANIFYHDNGERILLEYCKETNTFKGKNNECKFTKEELLAIIDDKPQFVSNNVVTRPLMQEYLFPTLAFISGPGEIAYWSELKEAFSIVGYKMPPIVPRLNITLLESSVETDISEINSTIEEIMVNGVEQIKTRWIQQREKNDISEIVESVKREIDSLHCKLKDAALQIDPSMEPLLEKNKWMVLKQFDFVERTVNKRINEKYEVEINKFRRIAQSITPNNAPQERVWNIYYYINKYGFNFVEKLSQLPLQLNGRHKVIKI
ncbi:bacillithiol biosynthesis cysteine-adding enzyme BshC [Bacillus timonensis]|nr:bacillithiol biosynthesis cysteine-adding enzyme BshC [Bacillus timonensis]